MRQADGRIHVLYAESNVDGTVGGSHYCLLYLIRVLDKTRFRPFVVFYQEHDLFQAFRDAGAEVILIQHPRPFHLLGPRGARIPGWRSLVAWLQRSLNFTLFVRSVRFYRRLLRSLGIQLVHQNNSIERHHALMFTCWLVGLPFIAHERGINKRYTMAARFFARRASAVISMSRSIRDIMIARGVPGDGIRVLYDGLDLKRALPARPPRDIRDELCIAPEQPVVGIVGNIRAWKGQDVVVRAMGLVAASRPDAVCLLVGNVAEADRSFEVSLRALISELNLDHAIRFTGYQSDVASYLNVMTVAIHASVEPEPFGMVVLEGMAMRKPVVGAGAGGVPEMIVEGVTGFTFPPGDARTLARRLLELISDPELAERMGRAGRERVEQHFTMQGYVREVQRLYVSALGGRHES